MADDSRQRTVSAMLIYVTTYARGRSDNIAGKQVVRDAQPREVCSKHALRPTDLGEEASSNEKGIM